MKTIVKVGGPPGGSTGSNIIILGPFPRSLNGAVYVDDVISSRCQTSAVSELCLLLCTPLEARRAEALPQ